MKFSSLVNYLLVASLAAATGPCFAKEGETPAFTIDGMQLIEDSNLTLVYAEPGVDMSRYRKIYLDTPYVAFKKNWQRTQNRIGANRVSNDDMAKIKMELSELFMDVFSKTLEDGGYLLVTEPGEDVLRIKPAIINLDIVAPDTSAPGITRTYSETAGEMTLYMELYDSVTGDLLARALDRKQDRKTGYFEWQNRVTNRAAANRILKVWAGVLKEGLDDARASSPQ
ncbi:MAG TPA: DUF3313 family protein [Xanthomonadales bacterium]